ncbi:hypothetical protein JNUCC0626_18370 [Lentzea sp. JNUCC 0626]|uniref:hypothetical protein n=1 Tax=Lentzea sp. JNUCC 0626 TaxID=3367513 RepID=UPI0037480778
MTASSSSTSTGSDISESDLEAGRALHASLLAEARGFINDFIERRAEADKLGTPIPSTEDVLENPAFWLIGPGRALTDTALCEHKILITNLCPFCLCECRQPA